MKFRFLSALLPFVFCASVTAFATEVRVSNLGRSAGLDDEGYFFAYPSLIATKNVAFAQFGSPVVGEPYLAATHAYGFGSLGLGFNRESSVFTYYNAATSSSDVPDLGTVFMTRYSLFKKVFSVMPQAERPLDVIYALPFGSDSALGIRASWATNMDDVQGSPAETFSARQLDLHVGFHMPLAGRLDLALMLGAIGDTTSEKISTSGTLVRTSFKRKPEIRLLARHEGDDAKNNFFQKFGFDMRSGDFSDDMGTAVKKQTAKEMDIDLQTGIISQVADNVSLNMSGAGFYTTSEGPFAVTNAANMTLAKSLRAGVEKASLDYDKGNSKRTSYGLLVGAGADAKVTESFGMMMGLEYVAWGVTQLKYTKEAPNTLIKSNLGAGAGADLWKVGAYYTKEALRVDASTQLKGLTHNGLYLVSGTPTANLVGQIAASYQY